MKTKKHSIYSPSSASRWTRCLGSIKLNKNLPYEKKPSAEEGEKAHKLLEDYIKGADLDQLLFENNFSQESKEYFIDSKNYIQNEIDYLRLEFKDLHIEKRVDIGYLIKGMFGTLDYGLSNQNTLSIMDFKYGKAVSISAYDNEQLELYALGFLKHIEKEKLFIERIRMHIIQPRMGRFVFVEKSIEDLKALEQKYVEISIKIELNDFPFKVGDIQCNYCPSKLSCGAFNDNISNIMSITKKAHDSDSQLLLTKEKAVWLFRNKKHVLDTFNAVEQYLVKSINEGENIAGIKLIEGRKIRKLKEGAFEKLKLKYGDKIISNKEKGILELEKIIDKEELKQHVEYHQSAPKLAKSEHLGKTFQNIEKIMTIG